MSDLNSRNMRHDSWATMGAGSNANVMGSAHCHGRNEYANAEYIIISIGHKMRFITKRIELRKA